MLSIAKIAHGAFLRVLPTSAFVMAVGLVPMLVSRVPGLSPRAPWIVAAEVISASVGFFAILALLRRRLDPHAPVDARPSIVAGIVMPIAVMVGLMIVGSPHSFTDIVVTSLASGAAVGTAMFFPWLTGNRQGQVESSSAEMLKPPEFVAASVEPELGVRREQSV